jgi:hypothetical protein
MTAPILDVVTSWPPLASLLALPNGNLAVFPTVAPHDTPRPYIVYSQSDKTPIMPLAHIPDADYDRFAFDCWASERDDALALAEALRDAFDHYLNGSPWGYLASGFTEMFDIETRAYVVAFDWGVFTQRGGPPLQRPTIRT